MNISTGTSTTTSSQVEVVYLLGEVEAMQDDDYVTDYKEGKTFSVLERFLNVDNLLFYIKQIDDFKKWLLFLKRLKTPPWEKCLRQ